MYKRQVHAGEAASRPDWVAVGTFLEEYLTVIGFEAVIDYAELIHRARVLLTSSEVSALVRAEISYVFCDEFAELDPSQASFLADLARAGCRVRAFADPSTSAYGFRGADPRAVRDGGAWLANRIESVPSLLTWSVTRRTSGRGWNGPSA